MSKISTLLQDADPLRRETPFLDAERERVREAMLRAIRVRPGAAKRVRLTLATALAVALISVSAIGYFGWIRGTTSLLAAVRFEVRLAEFRPMPGLTVAQLTDSGGLIYLHPEIVVANDNIAQSWVILDESGRFAVSVALLPSGAERMRQATAKHVGRPVAFLIDGRVATAPVVRSPIHDSAVISGYFTREDAERVAQGIAPF
jgi:hypothetical protein